MFGLNARIWRNTFIGAVSGASYGFISYWFFRENGGIMYLSFSVLVPMVMGLVAALFTPKETPGQAYASAPLAIALIALITIVFSFEAILCWLMLLPLALAAATLGVFIVNTLRQLGAKPSVLASFVVLPVLTFTIEQCLPDTTLYRSTHSSIFIKAEADTVWNAIKSVPEISANEYQISWTHVFGLPRPLAATLSFEGIGGTRLATFSSGLTFLEQITVWEPSQEIAFTIKAQGTKRQAFALGPEIGGRFVDVLNGRYFIERLESEVMLHLSSTQRLSSHLNGYAAFWVNAVMSDLQQTILNVIKTRCEAVL
jgi:hypothetical protein